MAGKTTWICSECDLGIGWCDCEKDDDFDPDAECPWHASVPQIETLAYAAGDALEAGLENVVECHLNEIIARVKHVESSRKWMDVSRCSDSEITEIATRIVSLSYFG